MPRDGEISVSIALPESAFGDISNVLGPPTFFVTHDPTWAVYLIDNDLVLYAQFNHNPSLSIPFSLNPSARQIMQLGGFNSGRVSVTDIAERRKCSCLSMI
jgi:hypothetical protein